MSAPIGDPLDLSELSAWAPELARTFVALSSDIALVIDGDGVIRTVEQGTAQPIAPAAQSWVGRSWVDTVSGDTRVKVERLLQEASNTGIARRREVNHTSHPGVSVPVAYTAIRLGENGPVLAVGRDLRVVAAIQERFIESQQDMERGYWNARQAESRYRLLFQVATDAVMVVDPETLLIVDANPAADALFASAGDELIGRHAAIGFAHASRSAVNELLAAARSNGQSGEIRARLLGSVASTNITATSFRADETMRLLVRVRTMDGPAPAGAAAGTLPASSDVVDQAPLTQLPEAIDATVVTDSSGRILLANAAFLSLVQLASESDARGRPLIDWLGTSERPLNGLIAKVRRQGVVRSFLASAKPARAAAELVDVSATLMTDGDQECIGFTIRRAASDGTAGDSLFPALGLDLERLADRIGDLPLASLLVEAATLTERHFVELALRRSGGNTTAAAALLGVSPARMVQLADNPGRADGRADSSGT